MPKNGLPRKSITVYGFQPEDFECWPVDIAWRSVRPRSGMVIIVHRREVDEYLSFIGERDILPSFAALYITASDKKPLSDKEKIHFKLVVQEGNCSEELETIEAISEISEQVQKKPSIFSIERISGGGGVTIFGSDGLIHGTVIG